MIPGIRTGLNYSIIKIRLQVSSEMLRNSVTNMLTKEKSGNDLFGV